MSSDVFVTYLPGRSKERNLSAYSQEDVQRAKSCLNRAVPVTGVGGIENILIAAWSLASDIKNFLGHDLPAVKHSDKETVLHELVLKSFEVFDIEQTVLSA